MRKMERGLGVKKEEIYRLIRKGWWSSACIPSSIQCAGSLSSALHRPPHISRPCTKQATRKKTQTDTGRKGRRQTEEKTDKDRHTETSKIEQIEKQQKRIQTVKQPAELIITEKRSIIRDNERGREGDRYTERETKREREIQAERDYTGVDISSAASVHASG